MSSFFLFLLTHIVRDSISILGIFFIGGIILSILQHHIHAMYVRLFGWKGILFTAWFGTPMHEGGHALMALLFRHRITDISFFRPNRITGNLGHVEHSYNPKSLYQNIGNFFIGAAPLMTGITLLVTLLIVFVPNGQDIIATLSTIQNASPHTIISSLIDLLQHLFSTNNIHSWSFWLFIYLSFCIAAHIAPSTQDLKNMRSGALYLLGILIIMYSILYLSHISPETTLSHVRSWTYLGTAAVLYAILMSLLHTIALCILTTIRRAIQ